MIPSRSVLTVAVAAALCACVLAQVLPISDRFLNPQYTEMSNIWHAQDQVSGQQVLVLHRLRLLFTESEVQVPTGRYTFSEDQRHEGIQFVFEFVYEVDTVTTVMDFPPLQFRPLKALLSASIRNQLRINRFVKLFAGLVRAVDHCHRHEVVHGLIKIDSIIVFGSSVQLSHPTLPCLLPSSSSTTADVFDLGHVLIHLLAVTVPSLPTDFQSKPLIREVSNLGLEHASSANSMVLFPIYRTVQSLLNDARPAIIVRHLAWILDQEYGPGTDPSITHILNRFRFHPIPELGPEQIAALRLIAHMIDPDASTRWSIDTIVQSDLFHTFHTNP